MRPLDISGQVFGNLTAVSVHQERKPRVWICRCSCGGEKLVEAYNLRKGNVKSCGCKYRDYSDRCTHGMAYATEYAIWNGMKFRCSNPTHKSFRHYGGRGISVCEKWANSFADFYADMGPRPSPEHSIDRIDNDGNYESGNCRWATPTEQANNKRPRTASTEGRCA